MTFDVTKQENTQYLNYIKLIAILWVILIQHNFAPFGENWGWVAGGSYSLFNSAFFNLTGYVTCATMPLCFLVSGYVLAYTNGLDRPFKQFISKKVYRLLFPAFIIGFLFQLYIEHAVSYEILIGYKHLWFVVYLFTYFCIYGILHKNKNFNKSLVLILFLGALFLFCISCNISNRIGSFFEYLMFFTFGFLLQKSKSKKRDRNTLTAISVFSIVFLLCMNGSGLLLHKGGVNVQYLLKSIICSFMIFVSIREICRRVNMENSFSSQLCRLSYGMYIFHMPILRVLYDLLTCTVPITFILRNAWFISTLLAVLTIPLSIMTTKLVNKYTPLKL